MPENEICYLSELVERNLDEILHQTEFSLKNYVGLTPEEAYRTINLALSHVTCNRKELCQTARTTAEYPHYYR